MAASNFGGFFWTEEKSTIILDIVKDLVLRKKLDPLADGTIEMVMAKVLGFQVCTLFHGITTQDLKGHLLERRKVYMCICIGFLESTAKIWMWPEVYEIHIKVTFIQI